MLLSKNQGRPTITMKDSKIIVLTFLALTLALPRAGADVPHSWPLAELKLGGGQSPRIETTRDGFRVANAVRIQGRVQAAADAFLCRVTVADNPDVVQLSIGRVASLRCNALFSPARDEAIRFEGPRIELAWQGDHYRLDAQGPLAVHVDRDYMKSKRGLKHFRPLDKSVFSRAPAGWCSWYCFWQNVREGQVVENTDWLAANFKKFGCQYVQIDDGWQGTGLGYGENRDWYITEPHKFPHGMKWLADYIRRRGLTPGIWLIPFVTSDTRRFEAQPELFIRRADGSSVFETANPQTGKLVIDWCGRYIVDHTGPAARKWFTDLFRMLCLDWGYEYVKIDGQGAPVGAAERYRDRLADPRVSPVDAYRASLATMKEVMGPRRFLLNCAGAFDSCGYCDGIRIGGDVGPNWAGMQPAIQATMAHLFLNNICFWTDPDVVCVKPSLTLDQARLWTTLVGITGQLLMASDDMPKLSEERLELLRRIFPVADIRPMDLYPLGGKPRIFDLRVTLPEAGDYDVVALFNWDGLQNASIRVEPRELGWPQGKYVYYDVWGKKLLGAGDDGLTLALAPTSCQLVAVRRLADHPQLVGTSRHITQGADDLLAVGWDANAAAWSGRSRLVAGDPYELRFTLPPGWTCVDPAAKVEGSLAVLRLQNVASQTVSWRLGFRQAACTPDRPRIVDAKLTATGPTATISWAGQGALAYRVYRNGELVGQTADSRLVDYVRGVGLVCRYEVAAGTWQGEGSRVPAGQFTRRPLPRGKAKDVWLDEMAPLSIQQEYSSLRRRLSVEGNPLRIAGRGYTRGLGTHARSENVYRLDNRYQRFEAEVGVDVVKKVLGSVVFQVVADGHKLFDSGVVRGKQAARKISASLEGVEELQLIVTDAGDGISCDHADWADARLIGNR